MTLGTDNLRTVTGLGQTDDTVAWDAHPLRDPLRRNRILKWRPFHATITCSFEERRRTDTLVCDPEDEEIRKGDSVN